jgi:hypothetical protein
VIARCTSLFAIYITLSIAVFLTVRYAHQNTVLYTALLWAAIADNAEILALITKRQDGIGRVPMGFLMLWEITGSLVFLAAFSGAFGMDGTLEGFGVEDRARWSWKQREQWEGKEDYLEWLWRAAFCELYVAVLSLFELRLIRLILVNSSLRGILMVVCLLDAWWPRVSSRAWWQARLA